MPKLRIGKRILKTGAAVFLTAILCDALNWPSIFAVITAILTIEPTISASIQKSRIRLPSAAIGAFFAMLFDFWLGPQPLTYMLSALATIYVIQLLRWNDSLLVATLTAVNMITFTDHHFLADFFIRLGTTSIGILVSTSINLFVFPPYYRKDLLARLPKLTQETMELADRAVQHCLEPSLAKPPAPAGRRMLQELDQLTSRLTSTSKLVAYECADIPYRRHARTQVRQLVRLRRRVRRLQQISRDVEGILQDRMKAKQLSPSARQHFAARWRHVSAEFPEAAVETREEAAPAATPEAYEWSCRMELLLIHCDRLRREALDSPAHTKKRRAHP